jgi:hypothetical protein
MQPLELGGGAAGGIPAISPANSAGEVAREGPGVERVQWGCSFAATQRRWAGTAETRGGGRWELCSGEPAARAGQQASAGATGVPSGVGAVRVGGASSRRVELAMWLHRRGGGSVVARLLCAREKGGRVFIAGHVGEVGLRVPNRCKAAVWARMGGDVRVGGEPMASGGGVRRRVGTCRLAPTTGLLASRTGEKRVRRTDQQTRASLDVRVRRVGPGEKCGGAHGMARGARYGVQAQNSATPCLTAIFSRFLN